MQLAHVPTCSWLTAALLLAAATLHAPQARAGNLHDHSVTLTAGTVTLVLPSPQDTNLANVRNYERVENVGSPQAGVAWCSRIDPAPAPNKPGSFPLGPFNNSWGMPSVEQFSSQASPERWTFVPQQPLYCTADSGTAALTAETSD